MDVARGQSSPLLADRQRRGLPWLVGLLCLTMLFSTQGRAEVIQARIANGLLANAEYQQGLPSMPAVLILHGFLATHHFPTVQHLAEELGDSGYSVLTPTLTLGISNRTTSLPCSALHLHKMQQTIDELDWWVDWLAARGHREIHLIGHSAGSLQILIYTLNSPHPAVRGLVLTSLVSLEPLPNTEPAGDSLELALQRLESGDLSIAKYDVSFCHGSFTAPPDVFLSYNQWNKQKIVEALQQTRLPTTVIMGGNDMRFTGTTWMPMLEQAAPRLNVLEGASHFFDGDSEFTLFDSIHAALGEARSSPRPEP